MLAELGAFLSHRLRPALDVPLAQELDHVAVYVRLEQARFPGRLEAELPRAERVPRCRASRARCRRRWPTPSAAASASAAGRVRLALRTRLDGASLEAQLDGPDDPEADAERVRIALGATTGSAA